MRLTQFTLQGSQRVGLLLQIEGVRVENLELSFEMNVRQMSFKEIYKHIQSGLVDEDSFVEYMGYSCSSMLRMGQHIALRDVEGGEDVKAMRKWINVPVDYHDTGYRL